MTTSAEALVTVVVACYNHRDYVEQALRSVFAQTLPRVDVIVTDDASKDDSQSVIDELVESHGWQAKRIYHSQNRGVCATFNEALSAVGTPFVAFISADDWMHPTRLERQLAKFAETPSDTALVHTDATMVDESGAELGHLWSDARAVPASTLAGGSPDAQSIFLWNYIAAPTVLLRAAAVRDVGGYDESLAFEDLDMWVRLALRYRFSYIPEPLTYYRRVANSLGGQISRNARLVNSTADPAFIGHLAVIESTDRASVRDHFAQHAVRTDIHYPSPDHLQPLRRSSSSASLPVTERLADSVVSLPLFPELTDDEVEQIVDVLARLT